MPPKTFEHPSNPQLSSLLLQIPVELRLKILRMLLRQDGPIKPYGEETSFSSFPTWVSYEDYIALSSQILQCCQVLYYESWHVLYKDNIMTVGMGFSCQGVGCWFSVLDAAFRISCRRKFKSGDILNEFQGTKRYGLVIENAGSFGILHASPTLATLREFSLVHIMFDEVDPWYMLGLFYSMQSVLKDANVTVTFPSNTERRSKALDDCINIFRSFCCTSIHFINAHGKDIEDTIRLVQSDEPVISFLPLLIVIDNSLGPKGLWGVFADDMFSELVVAAGHQDSRMFEIRKETLLEEVLSIAEEHVKFQVEDTAACTKTDIQNIEILGVEVKPRTQQLIMQQENEARELEDWIRAVEARVALCREWKH